MIKSELIQKLAEENPDLFQRDVERIVSAVFDEITDVMAYEELEDFASGYKKAAGFAIADLNSAPPTIEPGSRVR